MKSSAGAVDVVMRAAGLPDAGQIAELYNHGIKAAPQPLRLNCVRKRLCEIG